MELICASVCFTSMICFTLEKKYRKEAVMDTLTHMPRHHVGARGNATSFPLPWEKLLQDLQRIDRKLADRLKFKHQLLLLAKLVELCKSSKSSWM